MRIRVVLLAAASALLTVMPLASAQTSEAGCVWSETPIPPADIVGLPYVAGGTGQGDFAGFVQWVSPGGEFFKDMVLWNRDGSFGRKQQPPAGFTLTSAVDENSSGTVLLYATRPDEPGSEIFRYHGGHQGLGVYERLPRPEGFGAVTPVAINDRGDVLGEADDKNGHSAPWLWPGDGGSPVTITLPADNSFIAADDLDNDGTALLYLAKGSHLWRAGQVIPLATPEGYRLTSARSIRGGIVVGSARALDDVATYQGFLWIDPAKPQPIKDSAFGDFVTSGGMVVGRDPGFAPAVWQHTTFVDTFPANGSPTAVFDDGSILGARSGGYSVWRGACP
ncbi:hypothetical protein [Amycolatopsis nigrescens]|uniref:hypothetical protein n=1 Tax=Amycolatopsis nigrescens TaxID=381445 RepID=UPI0003761A33|nr:hypothetical protein [Amycolatopsis nigrescens]